MGDRVKVGNRGRCSTVESLLGEKHVIYFPLARKLTAPRSATIDLSMRSTLCDTLHAFSARHSVCLEMELDGSSSECMKGVEHNGNRALFKKKKKHKGHIWGIFTHYRSKADFLE